MLPQIVDNNHSNMDINDSETVKVFLKSMPVWEHVDQLLVDVRKMAFEVKEMHDQLKSMEEKVHRESLQLVPVENPILIQRQHEKQPCDIEQNNQDSSRQQEEPSATSSTARTPEDEAYDESLRMLRRQVKDVEEVYAMIQPDKPWVRCKLIYIFRRPRYFRTTPVTTFRLKLPPDYHEIRDVDQQAVAWLDHHGLGLRPTKRVIAGASDDHLMSGMIGSVPHEGTGYRYIVHFDDGSADYFPPNRVYPIVWQSANPWKDPKSLGTDDRGQWVHITYNIIRLYPRKYWIQANIGSHVNIERDNKTIRAKVIDIDKDILRLKYEDGTRESVYRGSSRLLRKEGEISKQLSNANNIDHMHPSIIIYMNDYQSAGRMALGNDDDDRGPSNKKSGNTARKSTASKSQAAPKMIVELTEDTIIDSRTAQDLTDEDIELSKTHKCDPQCLNIPGKTTESSISDVVAEFRSTSDLKVPLLLGWERMLSRVPFKNGRPRIAVVYKSPCGKYFRQASNVRKYFYAVGSKFDIDYFSFDRDVDLNSPATTFEAFYHEENIAKNSSGRCLENKYISLINQYNLERLPRDFEYFDQTVPHANLEAKGFSFNQEFRSSCDCDGDCYQRASCSCHILNEEFSGYNGHLKGNITTTCQYNHKRLLNQVGTGIFECNSGCSCSSKCNNRVIQNGIRFRLQLQKFPNQKGWGVVTLDDIPRGSFICSYTAELLDDADQYGDSDMYYADLDYISVNEQKKLVDSDDENSDEGVDIEGSNKRSSPSDDEEGYELDDDDNEYMPQMEPNNRRRYPARNASRSVARAQRETVVKFKRIHNILKSHDFTLDARMRGNLGRFLNHSCDPNCFAQNVFIETHDLRFPNVAFFAAKTIKALEEITWDYNYKMGTIDGRKIICLCRKSNCRGRIL